MTVQTNPRRGVLIAIEGIDGAGKTTQAKRLEETLAGIGFDVLRTKEPTSGRWGQQLRASAAHGRLPPDAELELFVLDRREHVELELGPALAAGRVVIVDRYYYSTAAYQGARGMDAQQLIALNETFAPRPDLLVLLDVDAAVGVERIRRRGQGADAFEDEANLRAVAEVFAGIDGPHVLHVDGQLPPDEVAAAIMGRLTSSTVLDQVAERIDLVDEVNAIATDSTRSWSDRVAAVHEAVHRRVQR